MQVPTYEEFEAIVEGAHLQPMKEDVAALAFKRSMWDSTTNQSARYGAAAVCAPDDACLP